MKKPLLCNYTPFEFNLVSYSPSIEEKVCVGLTVAPLSSFMILTVVCFRCKTIFERKH